jgi:hypothetical protein
MVRRTNFVEKMTEDELAFLLAFEANERDRELVSKRNEAYEFLDLGLATRLETLTAISQRRLHRRYERIVH